MFTHRSSYCHAVRWAMILALLSGFEAVQAQTIFGNGFEPDQNLAVAPVVTILRDDRVATLEMDYDAEHPFGQFWTMNASGLDDAGFLVTWWPDSATSALPKRMDGCTDCSGACGHQADAKAVVTRWLVTGNRRVQIQPLENNLPYRVRVERINSMGMVTSHAFEQLFNGGDGTRVAALRSSMTWFDDFNLPMGPADEKLWNNATVTSTDPRFNLFFINDQYHSHTLQGTRVENTGDRSQTSQRFRKPMRLQAGQRRRIVFDMDSPLSPRSVWYLDLNPVQTDLTAHVDFFDQDGVTGLPAGILRMRVAGQQLSVSLMDMSGASHQIAVVDMEALGRQAISNVRRHFEARVGTDGIEILIDGRQVMNAGFAPYSLAARDYELLWVAFGYNTAKDGNPYYLVHWDNFGFDGPVVDAREVHNYVTRIAGTDYQKASRGNAQFPTFNIPIPDDLRPTIANATAEAWLVLTYQMGDYSGFNLLPGDHVKVNGAAQYPLPPRVNNSLPYNPALLAWGTPHTVRLKLGDLVNGGLSPLNVGNNSFQFYADNTGILNVHVEVMYPPGSAPAYTPPAAIHHFPMHSEMPKLGTPARIERIDGALVGGNQHIGAEHPARLVANGIAPVILMVGNRSWSDDWAPQWMMHPIASTEIWSSGGTTGIATVELFLRRVGTGTGPGDRVALINTMRDAPAPHGRYTVQLDTTGYANGDYELFVQATSPNGLKSHPSYGNETYIWNASALSGAYYPIPITIQN